MIVGFIRSSNSNNSYRRLLAPGANGRFSKSRPRPLAFPALTLVHRQGLQLIHDSRSDFKRQATAV